MSNSLPINNQLTLIHQQIFDKFHQLSKPLNTLPKYSSIDTQIRYFEWSYNKRTYQYYYTPDSLHNFITETTTGIDLPSETQKLIKKSESGIPLSWKLQQILQEQLSKACDIDTQRRLRLDKITLLLQDPIKAINEHPGIYSEMKQWFYYLGHIDC